MASNDQLVDQEFPNDKIYKRRILLPVDSSEHSERAFQWFFNQLYKKGDSLYIVHVVQPFEAKPFAGKYIHHPDQKMETMWKVLQEDVDKGKKLNESYLNRAKDLKIPARGFVHVDSKPWRAILQSCEEHKCDHIVIGNRGVGKLKRMFLGSVSNHIVHHAHVPVTVVPPRVDEKHQHVAVGGGGENQGEIELP